VRGTTWKARETNMFRIKLISHVSHGKFFERVDWLQEKNEKYEHSAKVKKSSNYTKMSFLYLYRSLDLNKDRMRISKGSETLLTLKIYSACNVYYRFSVLICANSVSPNAAVIRWCFWTQPTVSDTAKKARETCTNVYRFIILISHVPHDDKFFENVYWLQARWFLETERFFYFAVNQYV